jgi:pimeloyl-ACP methyl ester carboxylesterase
VRVIAWFWIVVRRPPSISSNSRAKSAAIAETLGRARNGLAVWVTRLDRFAAGLTMPLLMVQGEEDRIAPAATNAELLAAALPHARLVMLARCGHLPEVELPSRVNDLIAAHLS